MTGHLTEAYFSEAKFGKFKESAAYFARDRKKARQQRRAAVDLERARLDKITFHPYKKMQDTNPIYNDPNWRGKSQNFRWNGTTVMSDNPAYWIPHSKMDNPDLIDFAQIDRLHDDRMFGDGAVVLIEEPHGVKHIDVLNMHLSHYGGAVEEVDHGVNVSAVVRKIAPKAFLRGASSEDGRLSVKIHADIVNFSYGREKISPNTITNPNRKPGEPVIRLKDVLSEADISQIEQRAQTLGAESWQRVTSNPGVLFIQAAGNDALPLMDQPGYRGCFNVEANGRINPETVKNMMWVSNITPYGVLSESSTVPGAEFSEHTLCALGTDVETIDNNEQRQRVSGTSFSAPTVTGVAALLKGKFRSFTAFDLKTCLLESADKFVFDAYGVNHNRASAGEDVRIALDPAKYGKGILNAKHALLYAEILNEKRLEIWHAKYREEHGGASYQFSAEVPVLLDSASGSSSARAPTLDEMREAELSRQMSESVGFVRADDPRVKEAYHEAVVVEENRNAAQIQKALRVSPGLSRARARGALKGDSVAQNRQRKADQEEALRRIR